MRTGEITPLVRELRRAHVLAALPDAASCRAIRERAGVSQAALATFIGCTQPVVSKWEAGQQLPRGDLLIAYSMALQSLARAVVERA